MHHLVSVIKLALICFCASEVMADVSIDDKSLFKVFISLVSDSISIIIPASLTLYSSSFSISNLIVLIVLTSSLAAF